MTMQSVERKRFRELQAVDTFLATCAKIRADLVAGICDLDSAQERIEILIERRTA